jgi:cyclin-dependent kinase-like
MQDYIFESTAGKGTFGSVEKWVHKMGGDPVAIKILEGEDEGSKIRELEILKKLRLSHKHENIVLFKGSFSCETADCKKARCLMLQYVPQTLGKYVQDRMLKMNNDDRHSTARILTRQLVTGLQVVHENNITHFDIKPKNLLVTDDQNPVLKICDFGCSFTSNARRNKVDGSRWYRPPESLVADGALLELGPKIDIWALGCVVFDMVTGCVAFKGDSTAEQLFQIVKGLEPLKDTEREFLKEKLEGIRRIASSNEQLQYSFRDCTIKIVSDKSLSKEDTEKLKVYKRCMQNNQNCKECSGQRYSSFERRIHKHRVKGDCKNFILDCLKLNPEERPTCQDLLNHSFIQI